MNRAQGVGRRMPNIKLSQAGAFPTANPIIHSKNINNNNTNHNNTTSSQVKVNTSQNTDTKTNVANNIVNSPNMMQIVDCLAWSLLRVIAPLRSGRLQ